MKPDEEKQRPWHQTFSKPHATTKPEHHRRAAILGFVFALLVAAACGFMGGYVGAKARVNGSQVDSQQQIVTSEGQLIASIADKVGPSVVSIDVTSQTTSTGNPYLDYYSGAGRTQQSAGTGIILSSDGVIITNRHVVPEGTTAVSVTLSDGTVFDNVKVTARASSTDTLDVAFLKISDLKGKKLTAAKLGDSTKMKVGDRVIAIGNALGQFQNTVTSGIISGYGRSIEAGGSGSEDSESLQDLFQTDAAINEGNSGGPLVNASGQVIGINTAIASDSQNIGFAIPMADVQNLIKQVLDTGNFQRPYLGVRYIPLTSAIAEQLKLSQTSGAYIPNSSQSGGASPIVDGSPASRAGLQGGDIITAVDGTKISPSVGLSTLLNQKNVGDTITLTVIRGGKTIEVKATLDAAPAST